MLRKLRRNSKEPGDERSPSMATPAPDESLDNRNRLSFYDLPAELRNEVYELVIADATLSLPAHLFAASLSQKAKLVLRRRKPLAIPNINGLLLASKQCRHEYLSVLLSSIQVIVEIKDFDFDNLIRVNSSLPALEVAALRSNRNLRLHLDTRNCTTKDLGSLRRWLEYRCHEQNQLPWKYEFPIDKRLPPSTMGEVRLLRELEYYADTIATLVADVPDKQQAELSAVIAAFEAQALMLEEKLGWEAHRNRSLSRDVRGLAGGGLM
jgi:hypothetical protein